MSIFQEKTKKKDEVSFVEKSWGNLSDERLRLIRSNMRSKSNKKRIDNFIAKRKEKILLN
ncbi:MAG TPA: hypothetical protein VJ892_02560 [Candidatus Absconditabacterales bacterium]|nr:hypothetical protein [Candidatus Absconditabacterales bacterium]